MSDGHGYQRFFAELKRRKVFRTIAFYGAAAFGLLQGIDILVDALRLPPSMTTITALAALAGFPLVVVLAWNYQLTPEGVRRSSGATPDEIEEIVAAPAIRRWPSGLAALIGLALFATGAWWSLFRASEPEDASVAVLPFADMSPAGDQEYFADGMAEEILNALVKVPELRVTARTSSFAYKGAAMDLREIGEELDVGAILEGSVRRDSGRVRVTAQLIDVGTGFHIWSETFTREPTDVFAIQDEIARSISRALRVTLLPAEAQAAMIAPTTGDPEAYDEYLRGRFELRQRTEESLLAAITHFDRATQLDPEFAPAWAGLGMTYGLMPFYTAAIPFEVAGQKAREAAERAVSIDPELPEAHAAVGQSYGFGAERAAAFRRAIALDPKYAEAHQWLGETLSQMGFHAEAVEEGRIAVELDSMSRAANLDYARNLNRAGRNEEAAAYFKKLIERDPAWPSLWGNLANVYMDIGAYDSAEAAIAQSEKIKPLWDGLEKRALRRIRALRMRESEGVPFDLPPEWQIECDRENPFGYLQGVTECLELLAAAGRVEELVARLEEFPIGSNLGFPFDPIWDLVVDDPRIQARKDA
ncbi:MAG: tetratricopeptide repeat protein, partial [marine benthic group bacterium]|nr:tetratricopeptide repeat protein [Gemmatimonadota bacterium]MCL7973885.1 tetratricopeptide repeat protein [Gemmatimonadota bacterium]